MPPQACAYFRGTPSPEQRAAILAYYQQHLAATHTWMAPVPGWEQVQQRPAGYPQPDGWFLDAADLKPMPFFDYPRCGLELNAATLCGDAVIFTRVADAFWKLDDLLTFLEVQKARKVQVHFLEFLGLRKPLMFPSAVGDIAQDLLHGSHAYRLEMFSLRPPKRRAPLNRKRAGWGYYFKRKGRKYVRVPDPEMRDHGRYFLDLKDRHHWAVSLIRRECERHQRLNPKTGKVWTWNEIDKAILGERRLQKLEGRQRFYIGKPDGLVYSGENSCDPPEAHDDAAQ